MTWIHQRERDSSDVLMQLCANPPHFWGTWVTYFMSVKTYREDVTKEISISFPFDCTLGFRDMHFYYGVSVWPQTLSSFLFLLFPFPLLSFPTPSPPFLLFSFLLIFSSLLPALLPFSLQFPANVLVLFRTPGFHGLQDKQEVVSVN